jgi:hypothetical protein
MQRNRSGKIGGSMEMKLSGVPLIVMDKTLDGQELGAQSRDVTPDP